MEINAFVKSLNDLDYDQVPDRLLDWVFKKDYSLKSLDIEARRLQSWYDNGLLPYEVLKGKKHTFNFVQLIWLYIVNELRKFGMPLKTIKTAKEELLNEYTMEEFILQLNIVEAIDVLKIFNLYDETKETDFKSWFKQFKKGENVVSLGEFFEKKVPILSNLFTMLVQLMLGSERFFLTIDRDGHVEEFTSGQAPDFNQFIGYSSRIVLPINSFFYQYVGEVTHLDFLNDIGMINKIEAELLRRIHDGNYDKITIKYKGKKMEFLEFSQRLEKADIRRISNIIARKQYLELQIKTEDGDIRYTNVTRKYRLQ